MLTDIQYIVTTPNNLIATTLIIKYWFNKNGYDGAGANAAIYVAVFLVVIILINYLSVGFFGEFEFWLSRLFPLDHRMFTLTPRQAVSKFSSSLASSCLL